ncbi:MAG: hypothetical protein WCD04_09530 [Terriglobia bacterium]
MNDATCRRGMDISPMAGSCVYGRDARATRSKNEEGRPNGSPLTQVVLTQS